MLEEAIALAAMHGIVVPHDHVVAMSLPCLALPVSVDTPLLGAMKT